MVTCLGLSSSIGYLCLGQRMLGRQREAKLIRSLLLAVVFPSGLILANTRATFEAFFSTRMDFNRTTRVGEIQKGGWRGVPELVVGVVLPVFAFAESNWSALFFFFAVSGLVSIGAMGAIAPARRCASRSRPASSRSTVLVNERLTIARFLISKFEAIRLTLRLSGRRLSSAIGAEDAAGMGIITKLAAVGASGAEPGRLRQRDVMDYDANPMPREHGRTRRRE